MIKKWEVVLMFFVMCHGLYVTAMEKKSINDNKEMIIDKKEPKKPRERQALKSEAEVARSAAITEAALEQHLLKSSSELPVTLKIIPVPECGLRSSWSFNADDGRELSFYEVFYRPDHDPRKQ
jgi:hypothetical protein